MPLSRSSALPPVYYSIFGVYEPAVTLLGFIGALIDPTKVRTLSHPWRYLRSKKKYHIYFFGGGPLQTHNMQAPWPSHISPPQRLPLATKVTVVQLTHVCGL